MFANLGGNVLHPSLMLNMDSALESSREWLEKVENATKTSGWTLEVDWADWQKKTEESSYEFLPELVLGANMRSIAYIIANKCEDEFFLEAFVEKVNKRKIVYELRPKKEMKKGYYIQALIRGTFKVVAIID